MNSKAGQHITNMFQFWILEEINTKRKDANQKLMAKIKNGLCSGLRFAIYPDNTFKLEVNVLYETSNGYISTTFTTNEIIDFSETDTTLWFKDNVGNYLFRKTHHDIRSYVEETSKAKCSKIYRA